MLEIVAIQHYLMRKTRYVERAFISKETMIFLEPSLQDSPHIPMVSTLGYSLGAYYFDLRMLHLWQVICLKMLNARKSSHAVHTCTNTMSTAKLVCHGLAGRSAADSAQDG